MSSALKYRLRGVDGPEVCVEGDRIVSGDRSAPVVDVGGEIRAGLINAHDHLHRNHYPRLGAPPYSDMYAWGRDIHNRWSDVIARARSVDRRDALLFGALKNLMAGVTTVVHHDRWEPDFDRAFPIRVAHVRCVHSLGIEPSQAANPPGDRGRPLCLHLAEGVTREMASEVREAKRLGLVDERLLAVHVVGADADGINLLVRGNSAVVWCPSSNRFLYGRSAPSELLDRVDVLLGTDSLLTAAGTLLDEIREARATGLVVDDRLVDAVGAVAAARLGLPPAQLNPGDPADLVVLAKPLLDAGSEDVLLVIVGGVPRLGARRFAELFDRVGVEWQDLRIADTERIVCSPLASVATRVVSDWPEAARIFGLGIADSGWAPTGSNDVA